MSGTLLSTGRANAFSIALALLLLSCSDDAQPEALPPLGATTRVETPLPPLHVRLRAHIDSLVHAGGDSTRAVFTAGNRYAVDYIARRMRRSTSDVRVDTLPLGGPTPLFNVIAEIEGRSDSVVVLCAHLDATAGGARGLRRGGKAPGAVDNATGIAALLEALDSVARSNTMPRYTLRFIACNAEERSPLYKGSYRGHHLGSRHAASQMKKRGDAVKGVIVLDMVGYNPDENYLYLFANARSQSLAAELASLENRLGLPMTLPSRWVACNKSDNESFEREGYTTVLFMQSAAPWKSAPHAKRYRHYHSSRDLPEHINGVVMESVTRLVTAYVLEGGERKGGSQSGSARG